MRELHHGGAIGDVFLSQPPGWGWFLDAMGTVADSLTAARVIMMVVALIGCGAATVLGRRAGGALGGFVAGATLAIAPPWPVMSSKLEAEVPSTTLAIVALALAERFPLLAGAAFAFAVSVKLLAVTAAIPLLLLARRRLRAVVLGAFAATGLVILSVAGHLGQVWDQAIMFHANSRSGFSPATASNLDRVAHFLDPRTPFALLVGAALVIAVIAAVRDRPVVWALWTWPPIAGAALVVQYPLLDHHMELLGAAWAIPAGVTLAAAIRRAGSGVRIAVAAAAFCALATAGLVQQWRQLVPVPESADVPSAVARLRTLVPAGSLVATDLQIVPFLAGDRVPPPLVDVSHERLRAGDLSVAKLMRDSADAKAFVVGRSLRTDKTALAALARHYRTRIEVGSILIFADPRR